jgi:hypothetical protein
MYLGRIVAILEPSEATPERLGVVMGGAFLATGAEPAEHIGGAAPPPADTSSMTSGGPAA